VADLEKENGMRLDCIGWVGSLETVTGVCDIDGTEGWIISPAEDRVEIESAVLAVRLSEYTPVEIGSEGIFQPEYVDR
jgi:hypothetical protein